MISLISHNNFSTEGLSFYTWDAEAQGREGQEISHTLTGFSGRVENQTAVFLTLTPLKFLLQLRTQPKSGFKHLFPHSILEGAKMARSRGKPELEKCLGKVVFGFLASSLQ